MNSLVRCIGLIAVVVALEAKAADQWQHVTKATQPLLPCDEIQLVKTGEDKGVLWIGTTNGAARLQGGVLRHLKQTKGLKVWDVTARPEGGCWIGHSAGALLVDGDRTVQALKGLNVPSIQLVGTQLWAIAKNESTDQNVIMQAQGEEWVPESVFKSRNASDLIRDSKGTFWLVLYCDGVMEIDPAKGSKESRHHLSQMNVTSIMTDSKGRTWCGLMSGGVMVRQDNVWKRFIDKETSATLSLVEDGDGKIWAATSANGVWVFDGKDWKNILQDEGAVTLLKMTSDKRIWVSTQKRGGLRFWNGTEWKDSLECPMPPHCLEELPGGVLIAGTLIDGLYILGDYSIKGEVEADGKH